MIIYRVVTILEYFVIHICIRVFSMLPIIATGLMPSIFRSCCYSICSAVKCSPEGAEELCPPHAATDGIIAMCGSSQRIM